MQSIQSKIKESDLISTVCLAIYTPLSFSITLLH